MKKVKFFVGANNQTGDRNLETIHAVMNLFFESYSAILAVGVWQGNQEASSVLIVMTDKSDEYCRECAGALKYHLKQDCVGLVIQPCEFELI